MRQRDEAVKVQMIATYLKRRILLQYEKRTVLFVPTGHDEAGPRESPPLVFCGSHVGFVHPNMKVWAYCCALASDGATRDREFDCPESPEFCTPSATAAEVHAFDASGRWRPFFAMQLPFGRSRRPINQEACRSPCCGRRKRSSPHQASSGGGTPRFSAAELAASR